jgi:glucosamine-6-phosphate deaminase
MDYYNYTKNELLANTKIPLTVVKDDATAFSALAMDMITEIENNSSTEKQSVFIVPVGPTGQYPFFVEYVNKNKLSLKNVWFISMDELLDKNLEYIDKSHKMSFRGYMQRAVYDQIDPALLMPESQRIFPDPKETGGIQKLIDELGGVDVAYGGVGINGHVAFNEPEPELSPMGFSSLPTRVIPLNRESVAVNSIFFMNGAMDLIPPRCITIGMREILNARKIRFACFRDFHKAVLRRTCCGEPSASFPGTLLQSHKDIHILVTEFVAGN